MPSIAAQPASIEAKQPTGMSDACRVAGRVGSDHQGRPALGAVGAHTARGRERRRGPHGEVPHLERILVGRRRADDP